MKDFEMTIVFGTPTEARFSRLFRLKVQRQEFFQKPKCGGLIVLGFCLHLDGLLAV